MTALAARVVAVLDRVELELIAPELVTPGLHERHPRIVSRLRHPGGKLTETGTSFVATFGTRGDPGRRSWRAAAACHAHDPEAVGSRSRGSHDRAPRPPVG